MFTRKTIAAAVLASLAIGTPACVMSTDSDGESVEARADAVGSGASMVAGALNLFSQFVNLGTTLDFFGVGFGVLLGLDDGYAELSDETIERLANAVGAQLTDIFFTRDIVDADTLMIASQDYNRTCTSNCSVTALKGYEAALGTFGADGLIKQANGVFAQLTKANNGTRRLAGAQHIVLVGTTEVALRLELASVMSLHNTKVANTFTMSDIANQKQSAKNAAGAVFDQMNILDVLFEQWFDNQYKTKVYVDYFNNLGRGVDKYNDCWFGNVACTSGPGITPTPNFKCREKSSDSGIDCECGDTSFQSRCGNTNEKRNGLPDIVAQEAENVREAVQDRVRRQKRAEMLGAEFDALRNRMAKLSGKQVLVKGSLALSWSYGGTIAGKTCTKIAEASEPASHAWDDNYLCGEQNYGLSWSNAGSLANQQCVRFHEAADPHTWNDNYLCSKLNLGLRFSMAGNSYGSLSGKTCVQIKEAADPDQWNDNFLCLGQDQPSGTWQQVKAGSANDISVGADGSVWLIGTNAVGNDYGIYKRDGASWQSVAGAAVRIAVNPRGRPWVATHNGNIHKFDGTSFSPVPGGGAKDIAVGADGSVWKIGMVAEAGGYGVYKWDGSDWTKVPGGGVRIAVDPSGQPWVVNSSNDLHQRQSNGTWKKWTTGTTQDVGVGADGSVWTVDKVVNGAPPPVRTLLGGKWVNVATGGSHISVGPTGAPWKVDPNGIHALR